MTLANSGHGLMPEPEPHVFVIFGATGDLARRKLIPAFYEMQQREGLGTSSVVLGVGRGTMTDHEFRDLTADALRAVGMDDEALMSWCRECVHYQSISHGYEALASRIADLETAAQNRAFYLALPPGAVEATVEGLASAGLNESDGWTRLVLEKPFGTDAASAQALNGLVHRSFSEEQVYRIDHYLGKDTVQNLLVFRFANALFEGAWNRDRIEEVQITVAESLGVEGRVEYYDRSGALRDMVQSHLTQLLTLVAMEPPVRIDADAIRDEKVKVLSAIRPIDASRVVRGQYGGADGMAGYESELGQSSDTDTYVALELFIDTWRWEGVPFRLRTGKRLPSRSTSIAIVFREAPISLFGPTGSAHAQANVLVFSLQPDQGFCLYFDVKRPGEGTELERVPFTYSYEEAFGRFPDAYETLLADVIEGDQTLFVRADEVEQSWAIYDGLIQSGESPDRYPAGSWGPSAADALVEHHGWVAET